MIEEDPEQDEMPPDSAERIALDRLTDAIAAGDELATAKALRVVASDPDAAKSALGLIADAFEDNEPSLRWLYPWRLKFAKRGGRGRPQDLRTKALPFGLALAVNEAFQTEKKIENAVNAVAKKFNLSKSFVWAAHSAINKKK
jgi:hypothetical protein